MLAKEVVHIPLGSGVHGSTDPRWLSPPLLAVCKNAEFIELGGLQKRKPYSSIGTNILGGGTISSIRKIVANGDELLAFTAEALYSWSVRDTAWVLKATYLAPKVTERSVFVDPTEQISTDRCEIGNCVITAWVVDDSTATDRRIWVGATDKTTGAVILPPTQPSSGGVVGVDRPRLVALASKALLFFVNSNDDLVVIGLTPGQLAADLAVAGTLILDTADHSDAYDVVSNGTTAYFVVRRNPTTSYELGTVSSSLTVSQSTKSYTCDGPIAITMPIMAEGVGQKAIVARANGTSIRGDVVNVNVLGNVSMDNVLGTASSATVNQIATAYRSVQVGGQNSAHIFWSAGETASYASTFTSEMNTLDDAGTVGTETAFKRRLSFASRAFDHNGRVYAWMVFAGESETAGHSEVAGLRAALQNQYFLFRDDGLLVATAGARRAAGFRSVTGHLPGVQSLGSNAYAFCGGERRIVQISTSKKQSRYSARAPRDIYVEFDTNEARRCVRLGETLYVTGGELRQYDGVNLTEVGWHIYPWFFVIDATINPGNLTGAYTWKSSFRWDNAKGERDRSTTATHETRTASADRGDVLVYVPTQVTHKTNGAIELWRAGPAPTVESPFFLVTSQDPTTYNPLGSANGFILLTSTNDYEIWADNLTDAALITKEPHPENGGFLENLAPPPATIIIATQDRLILAGISDNPYRVAYSRLRGEGEVASFHDILYVDVPPTGGAVKALAFLNETLIAFCETAVFALPGDGHDNLGGGQNYGPARLLSADVGAVSHESVALTPMGLIFKSAKGWYLLTRGWEVQYIGRHVAQWDSETVVAVHVMESKHQVRIVHSAARAIVLDYSVRSEESPVGQWSEWSISDGLSAAIWNDTYHYASSSAVKAEQSTYSACDYSLDVETAWIKIAGLMGQKRVWYVMVLGEYRAAHDLRVRIARDYQESDASGVTWMDSIYWSPSPTTVGGPLQVRHGPSVQRMEAIKIRLTDYADGSTTNPPANEALRLTGLALELGVARGLYKGLAAAAKQ